MRISVGFLVLTLASLVSPCYAQFTYAAINVPGAVSTQARGLNSGGEVVGFYKTTACTDYDIKVPNCPVKGFKFVNGGYTTFMVPGSVSTAILGVNDNGDLVGFYSKSQTGCSTPVHHGFILYHTNVMKTIDAASSDTCSSVFVTVPFGINKAGTVVGGIGSMSSTGVFPNGGWVWTGTFGTMNPGSAVGGTCCWSVNGIANNGFISGQVFYHDFNQAWFKNASDEDFYTDPSGGGDTFGTGVDSNADTIGYGVGGFFAKHIELNEGTNDAFEVRPAFLAVQFPGAKSTAPLGINDLHWLAGAYTDSSGVIHGFIAKPNF